MPLNSILSKFSELDIDGPFVSANELCAPSFGAEKSCTADSEFTYNSFQFEETLVTQWNLVCDQDFKVGLLYSTELEEFGKTSLSLIKLFYPFFNLIFLLNSISFVCFVF